MSTEVAKAIKALMEAAPTVWTALVRQQYIDAVACAVWIGVLMAGATMLMRHTLPWCIRNKDEHGQVFTWGAACLLAAVSLGLAVTAATCVLNPEYYAIKELMETVNP